jgi:hypothetical protein
MYAPYSTTTHVHTQANALHPAYILRLLHYNPRTYSGCSTTARVHTQAASLQPMYILRMIHYNLHIPPKSCKKQKVARNSVILGERYTLSLGLSVGSSVASWNHSIYQRLWCSGVAAFLWLGDNGVALSMVKQAQYSNKLWAHTTFRIAHYPIE